MPPGVHPARAAAVDATAATNAATTQGRRGNESSPRLLCLSLLTQLSRQRSDRAQFRTRNQELNEAPAFVAPRITRAPHAHRDRPVVPPRRESVASREALHDHCGEVVQLPRATGKADDGFVKAGDDL